MNLKHWTVHQESSNVCDDGDAKTSVTFTTTANVDAVKLINWIKAYDPTFDMVVCRSIMASHEEETKICDEFARKTPGQIIEMCDEFYKELHQYRDRSKDIPIQLRRKLRIGTNILQGYGIYWCPPDQRDVSMIGRYFEQVLTDDGMLNLRKRLESLSIDDRKSMVNRMLKTVDFLVPKGEDDIGQKEHDNDESCEDFRIFPILDDE